MNRAIGVAGVAVAGLLLAGAAFAITPTDKCKADKLKTAGKYAFCRMNAEAKAIKKGEAADYSKCDAKYGAKWDSVETKAEGACPVTGDVQDILEQTAECTDGLVESIGGNAPMGRFTDNADGTITDTVSGLMWEKKTELGGGVNFANVHDADNTYNWAGACTVATTTSCQPTAAAAALCAAHVQGDPEGCAECTGGDGTCDQTQTVWSAIATLNGASFGGYTDWRAPTVQELQAIVEYAGAPPAVEVALHGASCGVACTDLTSAACSCTRSILHLSATTRLSNPARAWVVSFIDGSVGTVLKPNDGFNQVAVRAVRNVP